MASKSYDKLMEEIGNMSVLELSELVDALKEKFNVQDTPMIAAGVAAPGAAAEAAPEKSEFKVTLESAGEKIKTIKALRSVVSNLSLSDAKKAVEDAPSVIAEAASKEDAQKMKEALEAAGAKVKLS